MSVIFIAETIFGFLFLFCLGFACVFVSQGDCHVSLFLSLTSEASEKGIDSKTPKTHCIRNSARRVFWQFKHFKECP